MLPAFTCDGFAASLGTMPVGLARLLPYAAPYRDLLGGPIRASQSGPSPIINSFEFGVVCVKALRSNAARGDWVEPDHMIPARRASSGRMCSTSTWEGLRLPWLVKKPGGSAMRIPTEPIGSIPRPQKLIEAGQDLAAGRIMPQAYAALADQAVMETIAQFEATGSPVITDGEQTKPSFATYPVHGLKTLAPDGVNIPFADGHTRQLPRLTAGPFRYQTHAYSYLEAALRYAHVPVKQAVISASALSLLYPQDGLDGYPR